MGLVFLLFLRLLLLLTLLLLFLFLVFLLLFLFQPLLLLLVSLFELLELLLLSLLHLLSSGILSISLLNLLLLASLLELLDLWRLPLIDLLLALLVGVLLSDSLPLLNLLLVDLLALRRLILIDSLLSCVVSTVLLNLLLLLDLLLLDSLAFLILPLTELLELLLVSLFHLRVDVVRPAVVIWPRRRRAIIVSPRIARPAEINWSVATVASGISRVGWRIHGLVRRIPRNGIVHRGRAIVVVSIVSIIARVAPDIARIILRVGRVIRRVVRRTIGLNASRRAWLDRRGDPYVGTRLLIVLDPCSTHLRNSRWHATIGLNDLLLLRKGNRRWRRSSPRYNRAAHCRGRRAHARFHTGTEHAALLGSNGRSGRINLRRLNFPAINLHHVSVDRLRRCKCFV